MSLGSRRWRGALPAAATASWLLATACGAAPASPIEASPAESPAADDTEPPPDTIPVGERNDGVLTIGLLYPQTGPGNVLGLPINHAADYAVGRINAAGGWNGENVVLVKADEGGSAETATEAINDLLAAGVDAVVGPASSTVTLATLDRLMDADVLTCSPTATSLLLDDYPGRDLFFRTIPSDSLQMQAIVSQALATGNTSAAVVYLDDEFGRGLAEVVERELPEREIELAVSLPFHRDGDLSTVVDELSTHRQTTIIVLADAEQGMRVLSAISGSAPLFESDGLIVINDAIRPDDPEEYRNLDPSVLGMVRRISPVAAAAPDQRGPAGDADSDVSDEPRLPEGPFVFNVVDCINLITLSAIAAESDNPTDIANRMRTVADGGARCETFADCVGFILRSQNIAYVGATRQNELYYFDEERGDVGRARVMVYRVNPETGFDVEETTIIVGPAGA